MTTTARYQTIREQRAYARRVAAFGLPALLAPYTAAPRIPVQRRGTLSERLAAARVAS